MRLSRNCTAKVKKFKKMSFENVKIAKKETSNANTNSSGKGKPKGLNPKKPKEEMNPINTLTINFQACSIQ